MHTCLMAPPTDVYIIFITRIYGRFHGIDMDLFAADEAVHLLLLELVFLFFTIRSWYLFHASMTLSAIVFS